MLEQQMARTRGTASLVLFLSVVLLLCTLTYSLVGHHAGAAPSGDERTNSKTTNNSLEALLCNSTLQPITTITLEPNVTYTISHNQFCVVESLTSLVIRGKSPEYPALIKCLPGNSSISVSSGFGFVDIQYMTIENVHVENCGGVITLAAVRSINDSYFYFGPGQSTVFLFSLCFDLQLQNITITNYTGYAVIGVNIFSRERNSIPINNVNITNSAYYGVRDLPSSCVRSVTREYQCAGSGILFYYMDIKQQVPWVAPYTTLEISGCRFANNYNHIPHVSMPTIVTAVNNPAVKSLPMTGGGALSIIYTHATTTLTTNVSNSTFILSGGHAYGATLVLYMNSPFSGLVYFTGCIYQGGFSLAKAYSGGDIVVYYKFSSSDLISNSTGIECLHIEHTRFLRGSKDFAQRHAHVALVQLSESPASCDVTLNDAHCIGDSPLSLASYGCLFAFALGAADNLNIKMIDVGSNVRYGAFKFVNLNKVKLIGKDKDLNIFERGTTPLLDAYNTDVYLSGNITFRDNHAQSGSSGGAILLAADSHLYLEEPLELVFENNSAVYGGAIYAMEGSAPFCMFQFKTMGAVTCAENCTRMLDINVTFINNVAELAGNSIYANPIYDCGLILTSNLTVDQKYLPNLYDQIFHFPSQRHNGLAEISSLANRICVCDSIGSSVTVYQCDATSSHFPTVRVFPGKKFSVWMQPIDTNNTPVYSIVSSSPSQGWELQASQEITPLLGTSCAEVNYAIIRRESARTKGFISIEPITVKTIDPHGISNTSLEFIMEQCPLGFIESKSSGVCECASMLSDHKVQCNTSNGLAHIPKDSWVGPINNYPGKVGFSIACPAGYCKLNTKTVNISDAGDICAYKRTGVLCGECPEHLSVVFGATRCMSCSNGWLGTIALYALAGIVLVVLLLVLRLSVATGSLNGLVFYGNVLSTNLLIFLDHKALYWLLNFIATINLDLGFPVCFYRGMNEISKAYFQFVFPVYLWSIAGLVVVMSNHSVVISRLVSRSSVPVLATVIHISFSKLTRAAIEGLASADVEVEGVNGTTSEMAVWYFDGSVRYCRGEHIGLFIVSLFTLLFFALPYTFALALIPFLMRYKIVNSFKPVIDAYCGPYKDNRRFWFGLRVFVLLLIFSIYEFLKGRNNSLLLYIEALILAILIFVQVLAKPYKSKVIDALDTFFLVNCFLLTSYGAFLHTSTRSPALYIGAGILVGLVFLVFSCVVVCHIWLAIPTSWCTNYRKRVDTKTTEITAEYDILSGSNFTFDSNDKLREPLLEDC